MRPCRISATFQRLDENMRTYEHCSILELSFDLVAGSEVGVFVEEVFVGFHLNIYRFICEVLINMGA